MIRALLRTGVRLALRTDRARQLLADLATADEQAGRALLEYLAKVYGAKLEIWEVGP